MVFLTKLMSLNLLKTASLAVRAFSTKAKLFPREDSTTKQIVLKYLDGKDNGIAVLGLNRPEARNALGRSLVRQLTEAISTIQQDKKIRVLILRSFVPDVFCAGADLHERSKMDSQEVANFVNSLRNLMNDLSALSAPVISALDGIAFGGGLEMALASDIRTTTDETKMGLVETKLAIIPGAGGTQRLPRIIGPAMAKELIYTARILNGIEAQKIGLVNRVVSQNKQADAAYQSALTIAREILPNGPIGVK
ncbi:PREDICTED: methylglutaconyl-CoA hydratase, mitochondrial isoform X2 [Ceratosolen solmsi marchali]|nr:PREDICTED: methylglutaconyl-CoA hydratase, mitochondrial isoform X2 [Ceratosolen solmsi marchali]